MAEEVMLRHAHLVVTISEVLKEELISKGIEPARIIFYPNCIDPNIFDPQRFSPFECNELLEHYSIPYDATVITFIGTFGQWHGAEVLAAAIERIYMQNRSWLIENKVHFLFVGDGLKMPKVRTILEDSGAIKHCTLTGLVPQDQAALHLSAADILISPHVPNSDGTRFFGSPTKLFEYMAMGKGIVASDLDQIGEVLSPGLKVKELPVSAPNNNNIQTAVLTQPGNIEELIEGIKFLVERKDWRAHLGKNARARALSKYTWSHHVDEILKGLDRVYYLDTSISS
jgi:glycosyltransferase involved in cell wall biosynthesis